MARSSQQTHPLRFASIWKIKQASNDFPWEAGNSSGKASPSGSDFQEGTEALPLYLFPWWNTANFLAKATIAVCEWRGCDSWDEKLDWGLNEAQK